MRKKNSLVINKSDILLQQFFSNEENLKQFVFIIRNGN